MTAGLAALAILASGQTAAWAADETPSDGSTITVSWTGAVPSDGRTRIYKIASRNDDGLKAVSRKTSSWARRAVKSYKATGDGSAMDALHALTTRDSDKASQLAVDLANDITLGAVPLDPVASFDGSKTVKVDKGWYLAVNDYATGFVDPGGVVSVTSPAGTGMMRARAMARATGDKTGVVYHDSPLYQYGGATDKQYKWNGMATYCYQPQRGAPDSGAVTYTGHDENKVNTLGSADRLYLVQRVLYWGNKGPQRSSLVNQTGVGEGNALLATHFALAWALGQPAQADDDPDSIPGYLWLKTMAQRDTPAARSIHVWHLVPPNEASSGLQNMIAFEYKPWKPSITSQSWLNIYPGEISQLVISDADWRNWKTASSTISTFGGSVQDHIAIKIDNSAKVDDTFLVRTELNYDADGDGKADKTSRDDQNNSTAMSEGGTISLNSRTFLPKDLGMSGAWSPGRYWFTVTVGKAGTPTNMTPNASGEQTYVHDGSKDPRERWSVYAPSTPVFSTKATGTFAHPGGSTPVHDVVSTSNLEGTANATVTLNYDADGDGKADKSRTSSQFQVANGDKSSPVFTPDMLGLATWQAGKYWFDLDVPAQTGVSKAVHLDGSGDANESWTVPPQTLNPGFSTKAVGVFEQAGGTGKVHDVVTSRNLTSQIDATVTLNYDADGDGTADKTKTSASFKLSNGDTASPDFTPTDLGMASWQAGKYWFDLTVPKQNGVPASVGLPGVNDADESWTAAPAPVFSTKAAGMPTIAGTADPVHDTVISGNLTGNANATVTLNYDSNNDGKADKTAASAAFALRNGDVNSPAFEPSALGMTTWHAGRYWFDLDVPVQTGIPAVVHLDGSGDANERWDVKDMAKHLAATSLTSQAANGLVQDWNQTDVTKDTRFDSNTASLMTAGGTQTVTDHVRLSMTSLDTPAHRDWDTNNDGRFDGTLRVNVETTMHLTGGKTAAKTIAYDGYHSTAGGNDSGTRDFTFTPADFHLDAWPEGDAWFTSRVTGVTGRVGTGDLTGFSCPAGYTSIGGTPGDHLLCMKDDDTSTSASNGAESILFTPTFTPAVTSRIAATTVTDGTLPKDAVTATIPTAVSGLTVKARADVYWSPDKGADGATIPANAKKLATTGPVTFPAKDFRNGTQTITFDPSKDQATKDLAHIGTGYVTYVWRIDKADLTGQTVTYTWNWHNTGWTKTLQWDSTRLLDMPDTVSDGWRPGREQAEQATAWRLAVTKLAHMGDADGAWVTNHPAAGAVLNMAETTDATGRTLKSGAATSTITLDHDGRGTFPDQTITAGQTRYYRIWETSTPSPMSLPKDEAYWIVKAVNKTGTRGATLTITGSSDETRWLLKGTPTGTPDGTTSPGSNLANQPTRWAQTLGNTMNANVTPPMTGSTGDTMRLIGVTVLTVLTATIAASLMIRRARRPHGAHAA